MKIVIPSNYRGPMPIVDDAEVVVVDWREPVPDEHLDAEVLVFWMQPAAVMADAARRMSRLRLVQTFTAGTDVVEAAGFGPEVVIASGVGSHDITVSEHALALTLALVRLLPMALRNQAERTWDWRLGGAMKPRGDDGRIISLHGAEVTVWGFGSIAATLSPVLKALGANVVGVARSAGERHGFPVVDEEALAGRLAETDLLIMILPATHATRHALDAMRLAELKPGALLVNVGRGNTVDEAALLEALDSGHVAAAALDVTEVEPLPSESPLWNHPDVLITPHVAGGRPFGADKLLEGNVAALREGRPLRNGVAR